MTLCGLWPAGSRGQPAPGDLELLHAHLQGTTARKKCPVRPEDAGCVALHPQCPRQGLPRMPQRVTGPAPALPLADLGPRISHRSLDRNSPDAHGHRRSSRSLQVGSERSSARLGPLKKCLAVGVCGGQLKAWPGCRARFQHGTVSGLALAVGWGPQVPVTWASHSWLERPYHTATGLPREGHAGTKEDPAVLRV